MKRVALGMSGGIDSTMSALILLENGFDVVGITMSIWDPSIPIQESTKSGCFGPGESEDLEAAKLACEKLGIDHHIIKLQSEYKENVLSYFCSTYIEGKTPNPCVFCNQRMKFGLLPLKARELGLEFDCFATGHYVRKLYDNHLQRWQLLQAINKSKDQSYFLTFLSQEQIKSTLFPLGEMKKSDLKRLAEKKGFSYLAQKKESQDFLETDDYSVLFEQGTFTSGDIVDMDGRLLGQHRGLINYTIGQRKNLGLSGMQEPYYVIRIDSDANRLVVGTQDYLYERTLIAESCNWVSISEPQDSFMASAKIRLAHEAAECLIEPLGSGRVKITFTQPQMSITPGQTVVIYNQDVLLGGGIIH